LDARGSEGLSAHHRQQQPRLLRGGFGAAQAVYVGASLRVIRAFGLRRKESVMLRPNACIVPFECARRPNFDHPCRLNADQGWKAAS